MNNRRPWEKEQSTNELGSDWLELYKRSPPTDLKGHLKN